MGLKRTYLNKLKHDGVEAFPAMWEKASAKVGGSHGTRAQEPRK